MTIDANNETHDTKDTEANTTNANSKLNKTPSPEKGNKRSPIKKLLSLVKTVLLYGLVFVVVYTAINWWRQPVMPANPQLQLTDYQGQSIDLAAMSSKKPTLVYFWGTWCPICRTTSPSINTLAAQGNYPVVTIAVKSGTNQELQSYLNEHNYNFTTINDQEGNIFADWQGQVTPSYVILKDGEMTQGLTGIQPLWSLKLRLWFSSLG